MKQDRLAVLEEKLHDLDRNEENPSFLASCRRDRNTERQKVLSDIGRALREYGMSMLKHYTCPYINSADNILLR